MADISDDQLERLVRRVMELRAGNTTVDLAELCGGDDALLTALRETLELETLLDDSVQDVWLGQRLDDRYTLLRRIGVGAMSAVYEARDESLQRVVAVKVMSPRILGEDQRRARFQREAHILAALKHRHIVPIYDHGRTDNGLHFLVMERLEGLPLSTVLDHEGGDDDGPWDTAKLRRLGFHCHRDDYIPQIVGWMLTVVTALRVAHEAGICHRDVKPSNIFVNAAGEAVLLDFGVAARRDDAAMTTHGSAIGTPAYMAPEQVRGESSASPAMDVYATCATLYHLLSRRAPYTGDAFEVLVKVQRGDPAPLRSVAPHLPPDLCAIVEHGLERQPSRRYASMAGLEADLRAFLAHLPVSVRPITRFARLVRRVRQRPALFGAAIAVLIAITASVVATTAWRAAEDQRLERHQRGFAAIAPSLAVEGSVARRLEMDRDERTRHIAQLSGVLRDDPADVITRMLRAALLQDQGNHAEASADLRRVAAPEPTDYQRAVLARYEQADPQARGIASVRLDDLPAPTTDLDRFLAGFHLRRLADFAAADEVLAPAANFLPARYLRLGVQLALAQLSTDAEEKDSLLQSLVREAVACTQALPSATARTLYVKGSALLELGDHAAAIVDLERSLALQPESFGTLNNLATAYRETDRLREAEALLRRAIRLRPWNHNAHLQLADTISALGEFDDGLAFLESLGEGDQVDAVDRQYVRVVIATDRYAYHLGRREEEQALQAAQELLAESERGRSLASESRPDMLREFKVRAFLANLAIDEDARSALLILNLLGSDPLNPIYLSAASEALARAEELTPKQTSQALQLLREVLGAQATQRHSERR